MKLTWGLALGWLALSTACGPITRTDGGRGLLPIGSRAPDIVARDAVQQDVRLSDLRGKLVVVYFYPSDGTPGCTAEACAFRDAWKKFEETNIAVIGVSTDSAESHRRFQREEKLPFPLATDASGTVASAYGVSKTPLGYDRVSFLVDGEGRIARVWAEVDPGIHADEVLREAKRVKKSAL